MNRIPALLLLCIPLLSACSSLGRDGRSHWRYRIDEHLPGSRFEQHTGTLFYRGRPVPEGIDLLYCPLGLFSRQRLPSSRAGITGWYRYTDRLPLPAGPAAPGGGYWWYAAPFSGRRRGTPGHWVWARIGAGEFWLDPAGLAYLAVREAGRR